MFSNLGKGSVLHGAERRSDGLKWFTGNVEMIVPSVGTYGQFPMVDIDIIATIDGKQSTFKGVHSRDTIADFGKNSFILADSENSLFNYIKSLLKTSEEAVNKDTIAMHEALIPQYKKFLAEMRPGINSTDEVKELKAQVGNLQAQLSEALALLKGENKTKAT